MNFNTNLASASRDRANLITFISSNDFDYLIGQLKTQLYSKSNILTRKLLVVPGDEPLRLFEKSCLEDPTIGMNFGYRAVNLNFSIEILAKTLKADLRFPKQKTLRQAILETIEGIDLVDEPEFEALKSYLSQEKRTLSFFSYLAKLFSDYAIYGIEKKLKERTPWQEILFNRLEKLFDWPSVVLEASNFNYYELAGMEVHLFGFSMIPAPFLRFFKKMAQVVPIFFYVPTVTKEIATDFVSDFIEFKNGLKEEKNLLLANFQTATLSLWKFLIDESSYQKEHFIEFADEPSTLLKSLKKSILNAEVIQDQAKKEVAVTADFKIFEASNPYREVEEVSALVVEYLQKGFKPDEIAVLPLDIEAYGPLIAMHFGLQKIPYRVDGKVAFKSGLDEELSTFIQILNSRLSKEDLIALLKLENLMKGLFDDLSTLKILSNSIENSSITFGYNEEHRLMILEKCAMENRYVGTCCHFFDQMNIHLAFHQEDLKKTIFGQAARIPDNQVLYAFGQLQKVLKEIFDFQRFIKKEKRSVKEFLQAFLNLIKPYYSDKGLINFKEAFLDEISISRHQAFDGAIFYEMLKEKIQEKKYGLETDPYGVFCAEFNESNLLGKKVIFLLGADEENLPKKNAIGSLDITDKNEMISLPSLQKGAFLQLLGLEQKVLMISYAKTGFDQQEKFPSVFLQKLNQYLDLHFKSDSTNLLEMFVNQCPSYPFLAEKVKKEHYDLRAYHLFNASMLSYAGDHVIEFFEENNIPDVIDILKLQQMIKDPVIFFVKEVLKINFPFDDEGKEFSLASFKEKKLIEQAIKEENPLFFEQLLFSGQLPHYGFTKTTLNNLKQKVEHHSKDLKKIKNGLEKGRLFIVEKGVESQFSGKNNLVKLPALHIESSCGKSVYIVGEVEELAKGVFFRFVEEKSQELLKIWPSILLYSYCSKLMEEEDNCLLFSGMEKYSIPLKDYEQSFKLLVDLYLKIKKKVILDFSDPKEAIEKKLKSFLEKRQKSSYHALFSFNELEINGVYGEFSALEKSFKEWFMA